MVEKEMRYGYIRIFTRPASKTTCEDCRTGGLLVAWSRSRWWPVVVFKECNSWLPGDNYTTWYTTLAQVQLQVNKSLMPLRSRDC